MRRKKADAAPFMVLGYGSCGACSQWRFSCACTMQASCASWRLRAEAAAIKRIIRDERCRSFNGGPRWPEIDRMPVWLEQSLEDARRGFVV